jgi:hypothetical protein
MHDRSVVMETKPKSITLSNNKSKAIDLDRKMMNETLQHIEVQR